MRTKLTAIVAIVLGAFMFSPMASVVTAQADDDAETSNSIDTAERDKPRVSDRAATIEERRLQRQTEIDVRIDAAREERVRGRCVAAQIVIENAINRANSVKSNRITAYDKIGEKLQKIVNRLDAAEIDSAKLLTQIAEFDTSVTAFFATFDLYLLALEDATAVDCETDTEGFLLALEDAKVLRTTLKGQATAIKTLVRENISTTLDEIKDGLDTSDASDEEV